MEINEILTVGTRAQELLYSVVKEHDEVCQKQIETISNFKSISQQLAHSIGAEERWQARLTHKPIDIFYESKNVTDIGKLHEDWKACRQSTSDILSLGGKNLLDEQFDVKLVKWDFETVMTGEQIVYHIVVHESYHRGQCSYLLQMFGIDPPNFDLPFMLK